MKTIQTFFSSLSGKSGSSVAKSVPEDTPDELLPLARVVNKVPSVSFNCGGITDDGWWANFDIDPTNDVSWHVVQEWAHILNSFAYDDPFPCVFRPIAYAPQGGDEGPFEAISWSLSCTSKDWSPINCANTLSDFSPAPIDSPRAWKRSRTNP